MKIQTSIDKGKHLTPKQRRFAEEYILHWNATRAAISAGYSPKSARTEGWRVLAKTQVGEYIKELQERATTKAVATLEETLEKVTQELRAWNPDGSEGFRAACRLIDHHEKMNESKPKDSQGSDGDEAERILRIARKHLHKEETDAPKT